MKRHPCENIVRAARFLSFINLYLPYCCTSIFFVFCLSSNATSTKKNETNKQTLGMTLLMTTTTGFAITRAFFARLPRRRIHGTCIVTLRFATAIRAKHFICVHFYQFIKSFSTIFTLVLQKRHFSPREIYSPLVYSL